MALGQASPRVDSTVHHLICLNLKPNALNECIRGKYFSLQIPWLAFIRQWKFYNIAFLFCLNCQESQSKIWGSTLATRYVFRHNYFSWFKRSLVLFIDFSAQFNIVFKFMACLISFRKKYRFNKTINILCFSPLSVCSSYGICLLFFHEKQNN